MSPPLGQPDRPRLLPATACRPRAHPLLRRRSAVHQLTEGRTSVQLIQPGLPPLGYQQFLPRPPRGRELGPRCSIWGPQVSKQQCAIIPIFDMVDV